MNGPQHITKLPERLPRADGSNSHPSLGEQLLSPVSDHIAYESQISIKTLGYLADHQLFGRAVLPLTAYMEMALAAGREAYGDLAQSVEDLVVSAALVIPEEKALTAQLILTQESAETARFEFYSLGGCGTSEINTWNRHANGRIKIGAAQDSNGTNGRELAHIEEIQARCSEEISIDAHYEKLREHGLDFGPSFCGIRSLWRNDSEAFGKIKLPEVMECESSRYHIHPVLLDACIQILAPLIIDAPGGSAGSGSYLPIGLDAYEVYSKPGNTLWSYACLRKNTVDNGEAYVGDVQLLDERGRLIAVVHGVTFIRADRDALDQPISLTLSDLFYHVEWQVATIDGRPATEASPDYLLSPDQVTERIRSRINPLRLRYNMGQYLEMLERLETLCAGYVLETFRTLGFEYRVHQRFSTKALANRLSIDKQHDRLFGRMIEILHEEGLLKRVGSDWEIIMVPEMIDPNKQIQTLIDKYPACEAQLSLVKKCGQNLSDLLRGRRDPLDILFPGGNLSLVEKLYKDSPFTQVFRELVRDTVSVALENLPEGRKVRILEIGGGTGGTTSSVLPILPLQQTEYVFTDISRLFTTTAAQKFGTYPFVLYEVLDIEQDPVRQGFKKHGFDIVIAASVLHATADLRRTLSNVKELLAPGGLLIMLEGTKPERWVDLTFGCSEGWWRFEDNDLRPSYALLSRRQWKELLGDVGFSGVHAIPEEDGEDTMILAQGPVCERIAEETNSFLVQGSRPRSWLIFADEKGGIGKGLADRLDPADNRSILVYPGESFKSLDNGHYTINPSNPQDFKRLLDELLADGKTDLAGVIYLWATAVNPSKSGALSTLKTAIEVSTGSVLYLVQTMVMAGLSPAPQVWLVTRGSQAIDHSPDELAVAQAPLWGLGQVIAQEHPEFKCVRIDLDPSVESNASDTLVEEIRAAYKEDQIAYRKGVRYVPRLVRSPLKGSDKEDPIGRIPGVSSLS